MVSLSNIDLDDLLEKMVFVAHINLCMLSVDRLSCELSMQD